MIADPIVRFLDEHQTVRRAYIGDGVYAGRAPDGSVWLVTDRALGGLHYIALDIDCMRALAAYLRAGPTPRPGRPEAGLDEDAR